MKIVICDDIKEDRDILRQYIDSYGGSIGLDYVIEEFESSKNLINAVKRKRVQPDIIFMDIYMDGIDGMEAVKLLKSDGYNGEVVFITTSPNHAVESYKVMANGYLLKPYTQEEFILTFKRIVKNYNKDFKAVSFYCNRLLFSVLLKDLEYIKSVDRSTVVHARGEEFRTTKTVTEFVKELQTQGNFLQCHRSCLINLNYVQSIDVDSIQMKSGEVVPLAKQNYSKVKSTAMNCFFLKMRGE